MPRRFSSPPPEIRMSDYFISGILNMQSHHHIYINNNEGMEIEKKEKKKWEKNENPTTQVQGWKHCDRFNQPLEWKDTVLPPQTRKIFLLQPPLNLVDFYDRRWQTMVLFLFKGNTTHLEYIINIWLQGEVDIEISQ